MALKERQLQLLDFFDGSRSAQYRVSAVSMRSHIFYKLVEILLCAEKDVSQRTKEHFGIVIFL